MEQRTEIGGGQVIAAGSMLRLMLPPLDGSTYADAQISDYTTRQDFAWGPPARLTIRAWIETADGSVPCGTAGFGFWNHPFAPNMRGLRLPRAAWFFYAAPPNNMALAQGVPGHGWKCATLDATRPAFLALLPTAPVGFLLMRFPAVYRRLWPVAQRALGVSERSLDAALLYSPHTYVLEWRADCVRFLVDGALAQVTPFAPRGPLGALAWIDNQYAIVTPQGRFGAGLTAAPVAQMLVIEQVALERA